MKPNPRFILVGSHSVHNYGVESIIRGIEVALRDKWPNCEITFVSRSYRFDGQHLADTRVKVLPRDLSPHTVRWWINGIARKLTQGRLRLSERADWVKDADCVISIGGDLYTLPQDYREYVDTQFKPDPYSIINLGERVLARGKPFVIWGASVGPFDAWPSALQVYKQHLNRVTQIQAREPTTIEYLAQIGVTDNVVSIADPAFLTPDENYSITRKQPALPLVGINLSPLSVQFAMVGQSLSKVIEQQAHAIIKLIRKNDVEVILLPHVVNPERPEDDDLGYLKTLFDIIATEVPDNVQIVLDNPRVRKMKGILKQCDAVIAARMHCCIHAASVGTPPFFLSYSAKSLGMSRFIYGDTTYCIHLEEFDSSATHELLANFIARRGTLRSDLLAQLEQIRRQAIQPASHLHSLMNSF